MTQKRCSLLLWTVGLLVVSYATVDRALADCTPPNCKPGGKDESRFFLPVLFCGVLSIEQLCDCTERLAQVCVLYTIDRKRPNAGSTNHCRMFRSIQLPRPLGPLRSSEK